MPLMPFVSPAKPCRIFRTHARNPRGRSRGAQLLQIKIDAVRALINDIQLTSVRGGRRVVLVHPAESMNLQAANGLLKVLEEPPADVVFILVTHARDKLLPTIKSRCRQMLLSPPGREEALQILHTRGMADAEALLAFHSGAPLRARARARRLTPRAARIIGRAAPLGILDYAAAFDKQKWPLAVFLDWLHKWLLDIGLSARQMPPLYYPAHASALHRVTAKPDPPHFLPCLAAYLH